MDSVPVIQTPPNNATPQSSEGTVSIPSSSDNHKKNNLLWILIGLITILFIVILAAIVVKVYFPSLINNSGKTQSPVPQESVKPTVQESLNPVVQKPEAKTTIFLDKVNKAFSSIDLEAQNITYSGVMIKYKAKITEVGTAENGMVKFTTDSKVEGIPNTWTFTSNNLTFAYSTNKETAQYENTDLKVGDDVIVAGVYITHNYFKNPPENQFALTHVELIRE